MPDWHLNIVLEPNTDESHVVSDSIASYLEGTDIGKSVIDDPISKVLPLGSDGCNKALQKALTDRKAEVLAKLTAGDDDGGLAPSSSPAGLPRRALAVWRSHQTAAFRGRGRLLPENVGGRWH